MARIRAQTIGGGLGITPTSVAFYDVLSAGGTIAQMAVGGGLTGTWALINSSSNLVALSAGGLMTRGAGAATSGTPVVQFTSGSTILQVPITATVIVATLPANTVLPSISPSGTPVVGVTLTATTGTWTGDPTPTYAYQWRQVDTSTNISGATNPTYTPVSGDVGHTLTCVVTATNIKGSASASAATTPAVISVPVAPVNTVAPGAPTGSANVGATLTAQNGTWTGNPSPTFTYAWLVNGVANGATGSTYVPVSGDLGAVISVRVTGTNVAGSASATSAATAAIGSTPVAPSNTVAPAIPGNPWPSSTLTVSNGTWAGNPTPTFTYQWKSGGTNISGATSQTYKVLSADLSAVITCTVTATNSQGSASATSASATIVEVPLITATLAGSALYVAAGDSITLGASIANGSYSTIFAGTDATDITYVNKGVSGWKLADIVGNAGVVDALIGSNSGKANYVLSVLIGTNDTGNATYYPSNPSGFVTDLQTYVNNRVAAGWDVVVLTIFPRNDSSFNSWIQSVNTGILTLTGCTVIDTYNAPVVGGFTASADTTLYSDGLHPTQRGQNYFERAVASALSARMTAAVAPTISSASITGSTVDGQILTAVPGTIAGHPTPTKTYQWKRSGTNISGATGATYTLQPADVGTTITVVITVTNVSSSASATSSATATITEVPAPTNSVAPVISGTATQGLTLTVTNNGTWTNSPSGYTYVWKRNGSTISGATASSYVLTGTDVGTNITCAVTATNNGGTGTATSNSLGPVAASTTFLLDTLVATSAAAYSTRKLRSAYAGSAINVRRSSDNATQDIGFSSGDLDTAALATFVGANSAFVVTWYDQSGNGRDITNATTAQQPRITNAGTLETVNSKGAPKWLGGACNLARATGFPQTTHTVYALIGAQTATTGNQGIVSSGGTDSLVFAGNGQITNYFGSAQAATEGAGDQFSTLGTQASYASIYQGSGVGNQLLRSGSSRVASNAASAYTSTEIMIGNWTGLGSGYQGCISEVLIFGVVITLADIKTIDASHSSYWGSTAGRFQDAALPAQTADTVPTGYNVTYSSQLSAFGYFGWQAFDQSLTTEYTPTGNTGWVARQVPSALTLTAYAVVNGGVGGPPHPPSAWTFEGSNDGSTWTTLDTIASATAWKAGERRVYPIGSGVRAAYTYHRINMTGDGSNAVIAELEFITS